MSAAPVSRHDAQRFADRLRVLEAELYRLEEAGVLTLSAEQKSGLEGYVRRTLSELAVAHDIDTSDSERRLSWGLRLASTLGGLALCAAVVLFFLQFWGYLQTWMQLGIVLAAPLLSLCAVEFAARREKSLYFAGLLSLVAVACFVQNLVTVGEVFNLRDSQDVLAAWGAFCLILAYAYGLRLMLVAGLLCLAAWLPATVHAMRGNHWGEFLERPEPLALAALLILLASSAVKHARLTEFPGIYRQVGMVLFFLPVLLLAGGATASLLPFGPETVERIYEGIALAGSAAAIWAGIRRDRDEVVNLGTAFFSIALYMRLHHAFWDWVPRYAFFAMVGAVAVVLVVVFKKIRTRMKEARKP